MKKQGPPKSTAWPPEDEAAIKQIYESKGCSRSEALRIFQRNKKKAATADTMRLNAESKAFAAELQEKKDQQKAEAAAKDVAAKVREFVRLAKAAEDSFEAAATFSTQIKNDADFRAKIEVVQNFFTYKKSHQKLAGENGVYATAKAWSKGELGVGYDYLVKKLREFHLAKLQKLLDAQSKQLSYGNNSEKPEDKKPEDKKPEDKKPEDKKPEEKHLECKKREAALKLQLRTATAAAIEADDELSDASMLALRQREILDKFVGFEKEYGNLIKPEEMRTYLAELPARLRALDENFGIVTDGNSKAAA